MTPLLRENALADYAQISPVSLRLLGEIENQTQSKLLALPGSLTVPPSAAFSRASFTDKHIEVPSLYRTLTSATGLLSMGLVFQFLLRCTIYTNHYPLQQILVAEEKPAGSRLAAGDGEGGSGGRQPWALHVELLWRME